MKTWTSSFSRIWIGLLLVSFSSLTQAQTQNSTHDDAARAQFRQMGLKHFYEGMDSSDQNSFDISEQSFLKCTDNQFAKAKIQALMLENRELIPRHPKRIRFLSKVIPGFAQLYLGNSGKALGNLALIGGLAASAVIFWPIGVQFGVFALIDWLAQGSQRAENLLENATTGRRKQILQEILQLSLVPN
jgi:hypothetical protein